MFSIQAADAARRIAYFRAEGARDAANEIAVRSEEAPRDVVVRDLMREHVDGFTRFIDDAVVSSHDPRADPAAARRHEQRNEAVQKHTGALDYLHAELHGDRPLRRVDSLNEVVEAMREGKASDRDFAAFYAPERAAADRPERTPHDYGYYLIERNGAGAERGADPAAQAGAAHVQPWVRETLDAIVALQPHEQSHALNAFLAGSDHEHPFNEADLQAIRETRRHAVQSQPVPQASPPARSLLDRLFARYAAYDPGALPPLRPTQAPVGSHLLALRDAEPERIYPDDLAARPPIEAIWEENGQTRFQHAGGLVTAMRTDEFQGKFGRSLLQRTNDLNPSYRPFFAAYVEDGSTYVTNGRRLCQVHDPGRYPASIDRLNALQNG